MSRELEQVMDSLLPDRRANVERRAASLILEAVHGASDVGSTPEKKPKSPEDSKT